MAFSGVRLLSLGLATLSWLTASSTALQVTPGSGCASFCLDSPDGDPLNANASSTTSTDIVCKNVDYYSTLSGSKFRTCLNCLQNSTAVNGTENDVSWYLYNLRYAVDVCLFSYPSKDLANTSISSPCALADNCRPLHTFLEADNLDPDNGTQFDYCSASGANFVGTQLNNCIQCLQADSSQYYLANFLTALSAGCEQKPQEGELLGLNGTLFSASQLGIVTPSWNQTTPAEAKATSTITTGTIVGVAFAGVLVLISAIILFVVYRRRQKRQSERGLDFPPSDSKPHITKSISSSISGSLPLFTTDYKQNSRNGSGIRMFDHPTTQHITVPMNGTSEGSTHDETPLFGYENFISPRRKVPSVDPRVATPTPSQRDLFSMGQTLDEMPAHPAYVPLAVARPSRASSAEPPSFTKPTAENSFSIQRFLETEERTGAFPSTMAGSSQAARNMPPSHASTHQYGLQNIPPAPTVTAESILPLSMLKSIPPPPSYPPPEEVITLSTPEPARIKGRRYVPPPIFVASSAWDSPQRLA